VPSPELKFSDFVKEVTLCGGKMNSFCVMIYGFPCPIRFLHMVLLLALQNISGFCNYGGVYKIPVSTT